MFKTMEEVRTHKNNVESKGLFTSKIYFLSPITNEIEERHIYADDNAECVTWLTEHCSFYRERKIKFYGYNCGVMVSGYLNPFETLM